jgi:hypothetical protein
MSPIKETKDFIKRHPRFLEFRYAIIFNISRLFGLARWPTFEFSLRYALSIARGGYWCPKVKKMGKGVLIDSGVIIRGDPRDIEIGE